MLVAGCYERFLFGYKQDDDATAQVNQIGAYILDMQVETARSILLARPTCALLG